jgi:hypothetical protein
MNTPKLIIKFETECSSFQLSRLQSLDFHEEIKLFSLDSPGPAAGGSAGHVLIFDRRAPYRLNGLVGYGAPYTLIVTAE